MHCELSPLRDRYAEIIRAVFMRSVRIWDPPVIGEEQVSRNSYRNGFTLCC